MFALLLAGMTMAKPSLAIADAGLSAAVRQFGEPATALELEETIVELVRTQDRTGLQRLAEQIDQKDGNVLEAIAGVAQGQVSADDPDMTRLALSLGPCHYANVLVRDVVFVIAEGSEAIIRDGVVEIDGIEVDEMYAQMMTDCERLKGRPARDVRIGLLQRADAEPAVIQDRLAALRDEAKAGYDSGDKAGLAHIEDVLGRLGKDKALDISCRLAATGIARQVKGYIDGLNATDADARKIAEARVRVAAISVRRDLGNCQ